MRSFSGVIPTLGFQYENMLPIYFKTYVAQMVFLSELAASFS